MAKHWQILVVEDDPDSRDVVEGALTYHNSSAEIHCAGDGQACLSLLESLHPTVIIMDLELPVMDGWQTLAAIRRNPRTAHLPVIAVTGYHSARVAYDAIDAGFDAFIPKPIDVFSFGAQLEEVIAAH